MAEVEESEEETLPGTPPGLVWDPSVRALRSEWDVALENEVYEEEDEASGSPLGNTLGASPPGATPFSLPPSPRGRRVVALWEEFVEGALALSGPSEGEVATALGAPARSSQPDTHSAPPRPRPSFSSSVLGEGWFGPGCFPVWTERDRRAELAGAEYEARRQAAIRQEMFRRGRERGWVVPGPVAAGEVEW